MMIQYGIAPPRVLLPKEKMEQWAVIACDQYTSEAAYWQACDEFVGDVPSTLRMILPEAYLGRPDEEALIAQAKQCMQQYLNDSVLHELEQGFVLVKRQTSDGERIGLVVSMDLEHYNYKKGAKSLIRPTEDTIEDRIPPRLRIRRGAALETPHIMVLLDDENQTVIEPLLQKTLPLLYDFNLMQNGGHIAGHLVGEQHFPAIEQALSRLAQNNSMLYAVGDGNHSLATAKAHWEEVKQTLSHEQQQDHPARFALVELVNLHSDGLVFHPIHRVVFDYPDTMEYLLAHMQGATVTYYETQQLAQQALSDTSGVHAVIINAYGKWGVFSMQPTHNIPYGTLQPVLEQMARETGAVVDYIHGDDSLEELSKNGIGFFMPSMEKGTLFTTVEQYGALPKKTFSMGLAQDKRYYLECKRIIVKQLEK
ncbi:DUF1015 domain-containing protein [Clostridia bacterium OttesenSCG-928-F22]|nr:DUF1015 domain-containing protein [Clostridia bacterium OttesenSCG-928-F22]